MPQPKTGVVQTDQRAAGPAVDVAIRAEDIEKNFPTKAGPVRALAGMSFSVNRNEFVTVVGPSGCGKSTIVRIIRGCCLRPAGRIAVFGEPVTGPRSDVGMVFQSPRLLKWRTMLDNVLLPIEILRRRRADYESTAMDLLRLGRS